MHEQFKFGILQNILISILKIKGFPAKLVALSVIWKNDSKQV